MANNNKPVEFLIENLKQSNKGLINNFKKYNQSNLNVKHAATVMKIIKKVQPDEIYNLGAQSHVAVSFETPEYTANCDALGILRILEAVKNLNLIKGHLWPYTSSFIQKFPEILLYFILLIDGISKSEKFLHDASIRLKRTQNFCNVKLEDQFKIEKEFWKNFILRTNNILDVKSSLREIIYSSQIVK